MKRFFSLFLILGIAFILSEGKEFPEEMGEVSWRRDYEQAIVDAKKQEKPVFLMFNEIPGCSTCVNFGQKPLSHPVVISAIEDNFVPVAIYNNQPGKDAKLLRKYREPSWNNPVFRFYDKDHKEIIARQQGYSTAFVLSRICQALKSNQQKVPTYLKLVTKEYNSRNLETGVFAMYCYWSGEAKLASLPGVMKTRAGYLGGYEVVSVTFDPKVLQYERLVKEAQKFQCASRVFARSEKQMEIARRLVGDRAERNNKEIRLASNKDRKYHLQRYPSYYYLPLTERQASLLNFSLAYRKDPSRFLAPQQIAMEKQIRQKLQNNSRWRPGTLPQRSPKQIADYYRLLKNKLR